MEINDKELYRYRVLVVMRDKKSRVWDSPVTYDSAEAAIRQMQYLSKYGKDSRGNPPLFAQYPDDFDLYAVALFDWSTGEIRPVNDHIGSVAEILAKSAN